MTTPPQLPVQFTIEIPILAATDLADVELQADDPSASELAGAPFLLTAALASRTWTQIAQELRLQSKFTHSRAPNMGEKLKTRPGAVHRREAACLAFSAWRPEAHCSAWVRLMLRDAGLGALAVSLLCTDSS